MKIVFFVFAVMVLTLTAPVAQAQGRTERIVTRGIDAGRDVAVVIYQERGRREELATHERISKDGNQTGQRINRDSVNGGTEQAKIYMGGQVAIAQMENDTRRAADAINGNAANVRYNRDASGFGVGVTSQRQAELDAMSREAIARKQAGEEAAKKP